MNIKIDKFNSIGLSKKPLIIAEISIYWKQMMDLELKIKQFIENINTDALRLLMLGNILPILVKNFLVFETTRDIFLEKNVLENEIKNFYLKNNIKNKESLNRFLKSKGIGEETLHYQISLPLKIYLYAEKNFKNELEEYFLKQKESLDEYTFNIIRVKENNLAHEIYFQLDSEESDFLKLSQRYSFYSSLYPKGVFGPRNLRGVNAIIREKLINSSDGKLIMPFQVDEFWLIIKLIKKKKAKLDNKTTKMLLTEIFDNFINKLTQNFLEDHFKLN